MLYSGRWTSGRQATNVARALATHKEHLIAPLSDYGRRRVLIAFAGTASQWCSPNASLLANGPNPAADEALRAELQAAFPEYPVVAGTFEEPDLTALPQAMLDMAARAGDAYTATDTLSYTERLRMDTDWMAAWAGQTVNVARAASLLERPSTPEWARTAERIVFARSRIDVAYDPAVRFQAPAPYDENLVLAEPGWEKQFNPECYGLCLPKWRDFTLVFSGYRCLQALTAPVTASPPAVRVRLGLGLRWAGLRAEEQNELVLSDAGCGMAPLTASYSPTTTSRQPDEQSGRYQESHGSRLIAPTGDRADDETRHQLWTRTCAGPTHVSQ